MRVLVCHYHEIALKGRNRGKFERLLVERLLQVVGDEHIRSIKRARGIILAELTPRGERRRDALARRLQYVYGAAYFAFAVRAKLTIPAITRAACSLIAAEQGATFRITARRACKQFPYSSQEVNEKVGASVVRRLGKKVQLTNPDIECSIEIRESEALLYTKKIRGGGGLPVGSTGKGLVLLSGGIDSPVAAARMMRRGMEIAAVHFHSIPHTSPASIEKVRALCGVLARAQGSIRLFLVPFADIQRAIVASGAKEKFRVLFYRRMMLRIAGALAHRAGAAALITGENLGQVASQTLENIAVIAKAVDNPILRPLLGFDKEEIIREAEALGTFPISSLPDEDCCSLFVPAHPATKAAAAAVQEEEQKIAVADLVNQAVSRAEEEEREAQWEEKEKAR
ncbi:tRNA 4-thiouridine(8) synthase ThiI [Candidatus Parcubacteria bacterium]|nr:MAG: tRNA 4-thiouridine(8) synthase ThiI [Candidatus Parcubacteria bacterium]